MPKTQTELLAEVNDNVSELIGIVENKDAVIDAKVDGKIQEMESWKESNLATNAGVNLYQNSRFIKLNAEGTHPLGFSHYYGGGTPVYSIVAPDFTATTGEGKIVADLVKLVGASSWYETKFNALKVVCKGTKNTSNRHWTLDQTVNKGKSPLTRGCYVHILKSSVTNTEVPMCIAGNPSGANTNWVVESDKPILLMGQGMSGGQRLGFNLNVDLRVVTDTEEIVFYIVAPFFIEGYVDGYRTSTLDIEKI